MLVKVQKLILMIFSTPTWPSSKSGCFIDSSTKIKKLPSRDQAMFNEAANFDVTTCRELLCMKSCWKWHLYEHRIEANPQHKAPGALMPRNLATSVNNMTSRKYKILLLYLYCPDAIPHFSPSHSKSSLLDLTKTNHKRGGHDSFHRVNGNTRGKFTQFFSSQRRGKTISLRGWRLISFKSSTFSTFGYLFGTFEHFVFPEVLWLLGSMHCLEV